MKAALFCLVSCMALSACALPMTFEPAVPQHETRNGDVSVRVPNRRHERDERQAAAERCAQYGRVARQRSGRDYDCVGPAEATSETSR